MVIQSLILVGGLSSRMGIPKHTLQQRFNPASQRTNQPLLVIILLRHHELQLETKRTGSDMCISVRDERQKEDVCQLLALYDLPQSMGIHYVFDDHTVSGPAAGLLAAHLHDQNVTWLVTGCDYPLLSLTALKQLYDSHTTEAPILTCFMNKEGFAEPLLAIWSSLALGVLHDLATRAEREGQRLGPTQVIRFLRQSPTVTVNGTLEVCSVNMIEPSDSRSLTNVNTSEEWQRVQSMLEDVHAVSERTS